MHKIYSVMKTTPVKPPKKTVPQFPPHQKLDIHGNLQKLPRIIPTTRDRQSASASAKIPSAASQEIEKNFQNKDD